MKSYNRPYKPDELAAEFLYQTYLLLRAAPGSIDKWAKQGAFESIAASADSWRVIAISEDALLQIAKTGTSAGLQRGHWFPRECRYEMLFGESSTLMSKSELIDVFFEYDTTVVITREQNNARGDYSTWGRIVQVPVGFFTSKGYSFNVRKGTEIPWVKDQIEKLNIMNRSNVIL